MPMHEHGFGEATYELEKSRCARTEAASQESMLDRDPWSATQTSWLCPEQLPPGYQARQLTPFVGRSYVRREPWHDMINKTPFSRLRLPYVPAPGSEQKRSSASRGRPGCGGGSKKRLDHALPSTKSAWPAEFAPLASSEPFMEVAKFTVQGRDLPGSACPAGGRLSGRNRQRLRVPEEVLERLRLRFNTAAHAGRQGGQVDRFFRHLDRDHSGRLEELEIREAVRRRLRIPPTALTDEEIGSVCAVLDADLSGSVCIQELLDFIGPKPAPETAGGGGGAPRTPGGGSAAARMPAVVSA